MTTKEATAGSRPDRTMIIAARRTEDQSMDLIDAYLEHLRRAGKADTTIDRRHEILYRAHKALVYGLDGASDAELKEWLYRDDWSQNTKATYYTALCSFYAWAADPRRRVGLTIDPMLDLEPVANAPGIARAVTDEQLQRILTEAAQPYRLWATLAAYVGLRCIEISRLDREHITREQLIVVRGKGGRPRVHDTHDYVWRAVRDLPPGPVARLVSGERASALQVSGNASHHFQRKMKMQGVTLHRLRHWLGVTTQRTYKDIRVTQAMLGHRSLSSTQVYTDASLSQQQEARALLPRLAG